MILIPALLIILIIYALISGVGLMDLVKNILDKLFTLIMYLMLGGLFFSLTYLMLDKIGIQRGLIEISMVAAVVGALYVFHKTEDF